MTCEKQSHRMKRPETVPATILGLLLAGSPSVSATQQTSDRHLVVLSPDKGDRRLAFTRDAIAFWNQTFLDLKLRPRLVEADVIVAPTHDPAPWKPMPGGYRCMPKGSPRRAPDRAHPVNSPISRATSWCCFPGKTSSQ